MTELKRRQTTVVLFQGDDLDPIAQKLKDVERIAVNTATRRIGDDQPLSAASSTYDTFMDDAVARAVKVDLTALGRRDYRRLRNAHPVRMVQDPNDPAKVVVHEEDAPWGFNFETFGDALLLGSPSLEPPIESSITKVYSDTEGVAPDVSSPELLEAFLDNLSDTEFSELLTKAIGLNEGDLPDPKVRLSSLLDLTSGETSESPDRLA